MRALRYSRFSPELECGLEEIPVPAPAAGELLVRVQCASVNPVDWKIATGELRFLARGGLPRTMGVDFAGEVAALGPGVAGWSVGEPVMGFVDPFKRVNGSFAEYVPVPAEFVFRRPPGLDTAAGAALTSAGITAVLLCNLGSVGADSKVLVNGASGGVGHIAVQVAKARGAVVTAVASATRREWLAELGADGFIDYRTVPPDQWPGGFDALIDCVPCLPRGAHRRLLRRGGHCVTTLPGPATFVIDPWLNRVASIRRHSVTLVPQPAAVDELLRYATRGQVRCEISAEYPLAEAGRAIAQSRAGHVAGKLVVRVA